MRNKPIVYLSGALIALWVLTIVLLLMLLSEQAFADWVAPNREGGAIILSQRASCDYPEFSKLPAIQLQYFRKARASNRTGSMVIAGCWTAVINKDRKVHVIWRDSTQTILNPAILLRIPDYPSGAWGK